MYATQICSNQKMLKRIPNSSSKGHERIVHRHFLNHSDKKDLKSSKETVGKSSNSMSKVNLLRQESCLPVDLVKRAEVLLPYKSFGKIKNKERFLKHLDVKICDRYKLREMQITKKLREIDSTLNHIRAVTDIDGEFFKVVNGRPLSHTIPLYRSLPPVLNSQLRLRQEVGYKNDCTLNIEINFRAEKDLYELSLQRLIEQAAIFDKFIMEDYKNSMMLLEQGEKLTKKLQTKIHDLQNLADDSFAIRSKLIGLDYKYGLQQKYGRFLYYLSPPTWRSSNREFAHSVEIEAKGFDFGNSNEEDTFTVIFEKMSKECLNPLVKPVLYFTRPQDLMDVFIGMEQQQLYYFSREIQLNPYIKSLKERVRKLRENHDLDNAVVTACITGFKNLLLFSEERSAQLKEQFFKVLKGLFYESIGTIEVLKLVLHLEFCFNKVFLEKPMNIDMLTMAKAIESLYMDYSNKLDAIESDTFRRSMKKCMDIENRKLMRAKYANKELRLYRRLEQELLRAYKFNSPKVNRQSYRNDRQRIKILHSKPPDRNKRHYSLGDAELEYLTLFTDWTQNKDPALYLKSLSYNQEETFE